MHVYVKVTNRGKKVSTGDDWLQLYWADASTAISNKVWAGMEINSNKQYTGGKIGSINIPCIQPGETIIVPVVWAWPDPTEIKNLALRENHHFCLSARINETHIYPELEEVQPINAGDNKTIAQKNLTVLFIDDRTSSVDGVVYVRNIANHQKNYSLEIRERRPKIATSLNKGIYDVATVDLTMSSQIYNAWQRGGCRAKRY